MCIMNHDPSPIGQFGFRMAITGEWWPLPIAHWAKSQSWIPELGPGVPGLPFQPSAIRQSPSPFATTRHSRVSVCVCVQYRSSLTYEWWVMTDDWWLMTDEVQTPGPASPAARAPGTSSLQQVCWRFVSTVCSIVHRPSTIEPKIKMAEVPTANCLTAMRRPTFIDQFFVYSTHCLSLFPSSLYFWYHTHTRTHTHTHTHTHGPSKSPRKWLLSFATNHVESVSTHWLTVTSICCFSQSWLSTRSKSRTLSWKSMVMKWPASFGRTSKIMWVCHMIVMMDMLTISYLATLFAVDFALSWIGHQEIRFGNRVSWCNRWPDHHWCRQCH